MVVATKEAADERAPLVWGRGEAWQGPGCPAPIPCGAVAQDQAPKGPGAPAAAHLPPADTPTLRGPGVGAGSVPLGFFPRSCVACRKGLRAPRLPPPGPAPRQCSPAIAFP